MVASTRDDIEALPHGKTITIQINSWDDFFSLVRGMPYGRWYYRGHQNSEWLLQTGLDRIRKRWEDRFEKSLHDVANDCQLPESYDFSAYESKKPFSRDREWREIMEFRSLTRKHFGESFSNIDYLGAMQHYGSKTRLLDFSFSAFVAAYFAFEDRNSFSERAIYALNGCELEKNSPTMQDVRKIIDGEHDEESSEFCKQIKQIKNENTNIWDIFRWAANLNLGKDDGNDSNDIIPLTLEGVNDRLVAQDGLFLFPLSFQYFDQILAKLLGVDIKFINSPPNVENCSLKAISDILCETTLVRFLFDNKLNDEAHQVLRTVNISSRAIYPDIEGIARSVNGSVC